MRFGGQALSSRLRATEEGKRDKVRKQNKKERHTDSQENFVSLFFVFKLNLSKSLLSQEEIHT